MSATSMYNNNQALYDMSLSSGCMLNGNGLVLNVDNVNPSVGTTHDGPFYAPGFVYPQTTIRQDFDRDHYLNSLQDLGLSAPSDLTDEGVFDHFMTVGVCQGAPLKSDFFDISYKLNNFDVALMTSSNPLADSIASAFGIPIMYGSSSLHYTAYGRVEEINGADGNNNLSTNPWIEFVTHTLQVPTRSGYTDENLFLEDLDEALTNLNNNLQEALANNAVDAIGDAVNDFFNPFG